MISITAVAAGLAMVATVSENVNAWIAGRE